jgi:hypothetical protein
MTSHDYSTAERRPRNTPPAAILSAADAVFIAAVLPDKTHAIQLRSRPTPHSARLRM